MHETLLIKQGFSAHLFRNFKRSLNYANIDETITGYYKS